MAIAVSKLHEAGIAHNNISPKMFKVNANAAATPPTPSFFSPALTATITRFSPSNSPPYQTTSFA
jgi:hypothetical protein